MRVEIAVDEFVVSGLPPEQARVAAAALEARLTELAAASVAAGSVGAIRERSESGRRLPPVQAASPAGVGEAAAGAVWSELAGGAR
jgi:hypothetical protein